MWEWVSGTAELCLPLVIPHPAPGFTGIQSSSSFPTFLRQPPADPSGSVILGASSPGVFSPEFLAALLMALAPRKGLQLSSSERFSLLCSVQCIFHTLSFPAGRGLETLQAVGYCLSPPLLVCLLVFLGCHFCWISLYFFFFPLFFIFPKLLSLTKAQPQC